MTRSDAFPLGPIGGDHGTWIEMSDPGKNCVTRTAVESMMDIA
jgi:hypothetical protein